MIRVLFLVRPDLYRIRAGDTIQIDSLKASLEKLGVQVDIASSLKGAAESGTGRSSRYHLFHVFNILRVEAALLQCREVRDAGGPLILTPIYWNLEEYLRENRPEMLNWWRHSQQKRGELLKMVDLIAPNAWGEWQQIKRDFGIDLPCQVIYNGVDPFFFSAESAAEQRRGLICVGRIHRRKNQLQLIKALQGTGLYLHLVGEVNDPNYCRQCQEIGGELLTISRGVKQRKLAGLYRQARVHVLASWYDTPGLVNLEAGLAGCNLVTTDRGTAREYLGSQALYCNPASLEDIKEKVTTAYARPLSDSLARRIMADYTWEKIARETLTIYSPFLS